MSKKEKKAAKEEKKAPEVKPTPKDVTVQEADAKAGGARSISDCEKGIVVEAMKLFKGQAVDVQGVFAFCRKLEKILDASKLSEN